MQFTTLSVAFFAALATAHQHAPQHFHHRRGLNATGPSTTLTVYATSVYTITSCAASITDCPARASESTSELVVTDVILLTTTVCPVAEAASAASNVLASYSATATLTNTAAGVATSAPLGTGVSAKGNAVSATESAAGVISSPAVPLSTGSGSGAGAYPSGSDTVVLTYTLGSGTSTTVVTTTIKHVQTATVYATIPGSGKSEAAGIATKGAAVSASKTGPTTTIYGTSTSTKYITVIPASSASGAAGVSGVQGVVSGSAAGACVPVTVTVAALTVTVTETAVPTSAAVLVSSALAQANVEASTSGNVVIIKSTATVLPVLSTAAPYGNSTVSTKTKKKCSSVFPSSSFISKAKSTGTAPIALVTGY